MEQKTYDVVVAGSGTAGMTAAYLLAKKGLSVALVDRRSREDIGDKICGDAIAGHHFSATGLPHPSDSIVRSYIKGIKVYPRDMRYSIAVETREGGYVVDRHGWGQELLRMALDAGAELYSSTIIQDLVVEDGYAKGIVVRPRGGGEPYEIRAKVVVDATGYSSILIRKAPETWGIEKEILDRDIINAYREVVRIKKRFEEVDYVHLQFISEYAPTGYVWLFPWDREGYMLNIGNGVMPHPDIPKPHILMERYIREFMPDLLAEREIIKKGTWNIPNRRPRHVFVGNGFAAVGDSAIMIDPATAEGIGYGLYGAYLLSKYVAEAVEAGDYSMEMMWRYQHAYMTSPYGVRQARLDVFRHLMQAYSDAEYEFVIRYGILKSEEVSKARDEDDVISVYDKLVKVLKAMAHGKMGVIRDLDYTLKVMKRVKQHYLDYPERPEGIAEWARTTDEIFAELRQRFPPYIPEGLMERSLGRVTA